MTLPKLVSHDEWLVARKRLLAEEKDSNSNSNSTERATASSGPTGKPSSTRSTNTPVRRDAAGLAAYTQRHRSPGIAPSKRKETHQ